MGLLLSKNLNDHPLCWKILQVNFLFTCFHSLLFHAISTVGQIFRYDIGEKIIIFLILALGQISQAYEETQSETQTPTRQMNNNIFNSSIGTDFSSL